MLKAARLKSFIIFRKILKIANFYMLWFQKYSKNKPKVESLHHVLKYLSYQKLNQAKLYQSCLIKRITVIRCVS